MLIMKILKPALFVSACVAASLLGSCADPGPPNLLVNPGFEDLLENQKPIAWRTSQHAGTVAYNYAIDTHDVVEGKHSYKIEQHADQYYGIVKQTVALADRKRKTFLYTAMLKTKDVEPGSGLQLVVNCKGKNYSVLKQYQSESVVGNTDWQKITIEGDIPKGTIEFNVGIMLGTLGVAWIDDTSFSVN